MPVKVGIQKFEGAYRGICECGYTTSGWPSDEVAAARIRQHQKEEMGGLNEDGTIKYPMQPKDEFKKSYMLVETGGNNVVFASDVEILDDPEPESDGEDS